MGIINYNLRKFVRDQDRPYVTLDDIAYLLTQMPYGTTICGIVSKPIVALTADFDIKLHNDIFRDGVELKETTDFRRSVGFKLDGTVQEFNSTPNFNFDDVIRRGR